MEHNGMTFQLYMCSDTPHYTLISDLTYEYDEYGNWVLCYLHCVDGLQPDELTIREIEYW
jgi:hypothetical protein